MPRFISGALRVIACPLLALVISRPAITIAQEPDPAFASSTLSEVQPGPAPDEPIAELWRFTGSGYTSLHAPLVSGEVAITIGESDDRRTIIALDKRTGELIWQRPMSAETLDAFAIAGDLLFLQANDGSPQALTAADGEDAWTSEAAIGESPESIVTDGDRVFVTNDDRTVAVEARSGDALWEARPFPGGEPSIAALAYGILFAVSSGDGEGVIALDVATGAERWRHSRPGGSLSVPGTANDEVFVGHYDAGESGQGWVALDARSGTPLWESPTDGPALFGVATADTFYACANDGMVALDVLSGASLWSQPSTCSGMTVTDDAVTVASGDPNGHTLTSLSLAGEPLWSYDIDGAFDEISGLAVDDGVIHVGTTSRSDRAELIALSGEPPDDAPTDRVGETARTPECSEFASYDEVQAYYAEHPEAQPVLDTNMNGLACEVYFAEEPVAQEPVAPSVEEPAVADPAASDSGTGGDAPVAPDGGGGSGGQGAGDAPVAPDGGGAGGPANPGEGSAPVYTDFGGLDGVDYDCYDFATQEEAWASFEAEGGSVFNNADGLDRNHNGLACEPGEFD